MEIFYDDTRNMWYTHTSMGIKYLNSKDFYRSAAFKDYPKDAFYSSCFVMLDRDVIGSNKKDTEFYYGWKECLELGIPYEQKVPKSSQR